MKPLAVGSLVLVALVLMPPGDSGSADAAIPATPGSGAAAVIEADRDRITRHLRYVERYLEAAHVAHLTPEQRRGRAAVIAHLRAYREKGEFPHNHDFPDRTPYFLDHRGVACAMAYVIGRSGGEALVDRVAASANNAFVRELAADLELEAWLERNGLTVAEAALVQPTYGGNPPPGSLETSPLAAARERYGAVGTATLAADALALYLLDRGDRFPRARGFMSVLAGSAGTVVALSVLGHGGDRMHGALAMTNVAAGMTTVAFGLRALLGVEPDEPSTPTTTEAALGLAPVLSPGVGPRAALTLSVRF